MTWHETAGGRKFIAWCVVTLNAGGFRIANLITPDQWVTVILASFALLGIANVAQDLVYAKQNTEVAKAKATKGETEKYD